MNITEQENSLNVQLKYLLSSQHHVDIYICHKCGNMVNSSQINTYVTLIGAVARGNVYYHNKIGDLLNIGHVENDPENDSFRVKTPQVYCNNCFIRRVIDFCAGEWDTDPTGNILLTYGFWKRVAFAWHYVFNRFTKVRPLQGKQTTHSTCSPW